MLSLLEFIDQSKPLTRSDISSVEKYLDTVFSKLGMDVEFTKHFMDRVNDPRNVKQITKNELVNLFTKIYQKYGKPIAQLGPDKEAVLTDLSSNINSPVVLKWNRGSNQLELVVKTVMRKPNFRPKDERHFKVS